MPIKLPLKIGIIENDLLIAESIVITLQQIGYQVTQPVCNYTDALHMIETEKPDLLLVDIMLDGEKDGIDLAASVNEQYHIPFVFLTGNSDKGTIARAKDVKPYAYLVKPFNENSLYTTIEIAFNNYNETSQRPEDGSNPNEEQKDFVFIKDGELFKKVDVSHILYVESENVYLSIYTTEKKFTVRTKLDDFVVNNKKANLFRIHRSYAINLDHLERINSLSVTLAGKEIPLNKVFRSELLKAINSLK